MKIRSENTEVNEKFAKLLTERNDLRIGQMIFIALRKANFRIEAALFGLEDEDLIQLLEKLFKEMYD